jgi:hypothetical protein
MTYRAPDPQSLIEELVADLEPEAAVELTVELTRMIELGILELEVDEDEGSRVTIVPPDPEADERTAAA